MGFSYQVLDRTKPSALSWLLTIFVVEIATERYVKSLLRCIEYTTFRYPKDDSPKITASYYFIDNSNMLSSSINPSKSSPTTHSPTPAGVPVKMISPIFSEK